MVWLGILVLFVLMVLVVFQFFLFFFFFNDPATTEIYTLSLHDALPISSRTRISCCPPAQPSIAPAPRSEEHTSELQSRRDLVCRLLLEKKKKPNNLRTNVTKKKVDYAILGAVTEL